MRETDKISDRKLKDPVRSDLSQMASVRDYSYSSVTPAISRNKLKMAVGGWWLVVGGKLRNNKLSRCKREMRGRGADDTNSRQERLAA